MDKFLDIVSGFLNFIDDETKGKIGCAIIGGLAAWATNTMIEKQNKKNNLSNEHGIEYQEVEKC